jgi:hypothetical protein
MTARPSLVQATICVSLACSLLFGLALGPGWRLLCGRNRDVPFFWLA